jgi:hypothetical protein
MSPDNSMHYSYTNTFGVAERESLCKKPGLEVRTPFGRVTLIKNQKDLATFLFEEKIGIQTQAQSKAFNFTQIKELDQSLENIRKIYHQIFSGEKGKEVEKESFQAPFDQEFPPSSLQVLEGNNIFYIGVCTSEILVQKAVKSFVKDSTLEEGQINLPTQSHITFLPPSKKIGPSLSLSKICQFEPFDLKFDRVSISRRGNINLWGEESNDRFHELAETIGKALGTAPNSRKIHTKIGVLSKDLVDQLFADPEKFGFKREESGDTESVFKYVPPLTQRIALSKEAYQDEQILLKTQFEGATPLSNEEVVELKKVFYKRIQDVKLRQEEIEGLAHRKRKSTAHGVPPFNWKKLSLAIKGDPTWGKVPLTFSCRENGILMWREFCEDVKEAVKNSKYDDINVQMLGSGVHGFCRNPKKELREWSYGSDCDLAIFSKKMSLECVKEKVCVNEEIQLNGKFTIFKNERSHIKGGIGFYDTSMGRPFRKLQEKWSEKLYGTKRALKVDIDFKLNISPIPFKDVINVYNK